MKRISALLLALLMVLSLAACGGKDSGTDASDTPDTVSNTPDDANTPDGGDENTGDGEENAKGGNGTATIPEVEDLTDVDTSAIPGVEDGVLTVGMECAYAPYNWTQTNDSNGAVPIVNNPGNYANGYDVMWAKRICEAYGWELEVMAIEWDGLIPALKAGNIDAVIAGQSMTDDRMAEVDMPGPYFYASIVCVVKKDSDLASAKGISDLTGTCTAQIGTIWYDSCLPQLADIDLQAPAETAPAMIMAVESGTVDFICTDMPTAMGACATYDDLVILDFTGTGDDFEVDEGEINIGVSVSKDNTELKDAMNKVISALSAEQFEALMDEAIAVQPEI